MYKGPLGIGVDVVIQDSNGKILLIKRSDDLTWGMPGGWVDKGETPDQAAVREVKEETGLDVRLMALAHVHVRKVGTVHLAYIGEKVGGSLKTSEESVEVAFKDINKVKAWHTDHKERALRAMKQQRSL